MMKYTTLNLEGIPLSILLRRAFQKNYKILDILSFVMVYSVSIALQGACLGRWGGWWYKVIIFSNSTAVDVEVVLGLGWGFDNCTWG